MITNRPLLLVVIGCGEIRFIVGISQMFFFCGGRRGGKTFEHGHQIFHYVSDSIGVSVLNSVLSLYRNILTLV